MRYIRVNCSELHLNRRNTLTSIRKVQAGRLADPARRVQGTAAKNVAVVGTFKSQRTRAATSPVLVSSAVRRTGPLTYVVRHR